MTILIVLPWPATELSPNARVHWRAKSPVAKAARMASRCLTLEQAPRAKLPKAAPLALWATFNPPDQIGRDLDNRLAQIKNYLDGVFDALAVNDKQVKQITVAWGEVHQPDGSVELRIEALPR